MPSCFEALPSNLHHHHHHHLGPGHGHHGSLHHAHHGHHSHQLMSTDSNLLVTTSSSPSPPPMPPLSSLSSSSSSSSSMSHPVSQQAINYHHNGRAIRYYQPLMEPYSLNYNSLNQKRESVITFSSNAALAISKGSSYLDNLDELDDEDDKSRLIVSDLSNHNKSNSNSPSHGHSHNNNSTTANKFKCPNPVLVDGTPFTLDQIVCICQVLQKSDLHKLEKFIYSLPADSKLSKNELILRARAIASYHSNNYKAVYDILENNHFDVKYHQELQNLWNNAHYKEHELKRGHPPGAVEKYRIRKKFQFPLTIWDGEEYVYCFKEKNRRILKEFYQKCNLPTQEDKLKLSNQTQLTVVQISNWFKNRRQRDRQPNHEHDNKTLSDAHSNLTNESPRPTTPSTPSSSLPQLAASSSSSNRPSSSTFSIQLGHVPQQGQEQHNSHLGHSHNNHNHQHHSQESQHVNNLLGSGHESSHNQSLNTGNFCQFLGHHSQGPGTHRSYYFLPQ